MALTESSSSSVVRRGLVAFPGRDPEHTVMWLIGEHDLSTTTGLSENLARAIALDDADLVVDLSKVDFMSAGTVGVIVRAREFLRQRSRSLTLREASSRARLVFEASGLGNLLEPGPVDAASESGLASALSTWVEVPATDRAGPEGT